jgi:hypothetical protein
MPFSKRSGLAFGATALASAAVGALVSVVVTRRDPAPVAAPYGADAGLTPRPGREDVSAPPGAAEGGARPERAAVPVVRGGEGAAVAADERRLFAGPHRACLRRRDGSFACWGMVSEGGMALYPATPSRERAAPPSERPAAAYPSASASGPGGDPWRRGFVVDELAGSIEVALSEVETCARDASGLVRCWGPGLFRGEPPGQPKVAFAGAVELVAGAHGRGGHFCARRADLSVWCWGDNAWGQLGDGTVVSRAEPAPVPGLEGVVQIAAREGNTCARLRDGAIYCWGFNRDGQAGDGARAEGASWALPRPTRAAGISGARRVVVGGQHVCAVTGHLFCWGNNSVGQLGNGEKYNESDRPDEVLDLGRVADVALGSAHSCALDGRGATWCWGGEAGGGERATPAPVRKATGLVELAAIDSMTCGRRDDDSVYCWSPGVNDVRPVTFGARR